MILAKLTVPDLVDLLVAGDGEFTVDHLAGEIKLRWRNLEKQHADAEAYHSHIRRMHGRAVQRLINLAPANAKRKTVATADVRSVWQEALG